MSVPIAELIHIDNNEKSAEIYTDYISHEFGNPHVKQLLWGSYNKKPVAQMDWDRLVIKACQNVASSNNEGDLDFRPRIKDKNSGLYFLVDTGAAVSVLPKTTEPETDCDVTRGLEAVNGSKIKTYGNKRIKLRLAKRLLNIPWSLVQWIMEFWAGTSC